MGVYVWSGGEHGDQKLSASESIVVWQWINSSKMLFLMEKFQCTMLQFCFATAVFGERELNVRFNDSPFSV